MHANGFILTDFFWKAGTANKKDGKQPGLFPILFVYNQIVLFTVTGATVILLRKADRAAVTILASVKTRIECIEILTVQLILRNAQRFAETLEMNHLALPQEFNRSAHIRFVYQTQDIVIGCAGFLFCCHHIRTT